MSVEEIETIIKPLTLEEKAEIQDWLSQELKRAQTEAHLEEITRRGEAEFGPIPASGRPCGLAAGKFTIPDDFNDPLPDDVLRLFYEGE